ncbi:MAG: hypothetical protein HC836_36280 [Richelia sp. RM2_1_2]|nr:hypothetical protein [Richelia sp. SM2_1_7]NJM20648.1 hypothetical protein [Richelia sp. SM1_7_0]NJO27295.1 hypothetical protein [Richelia sp. SL_2_1]NJO63462.1 hypothetical protein [Richelia sp. RM2_1_2]
MDVTVSTQKQQTSTIYAPVESKTDAASENKSVPEHQSNREEASPKSVMGTTARSLQISIDLEQVFQHLAALGYSEKGDTVYVRAFYPSDDPRKNDDKGRKAQSHNFNQLIEVANQYQMSGRGVYIVVNGGGHSDKNVSTCRAIFYEHDNLDRQHQKELWRHLGLPSLRFK